MKCSKLSCWLRDNPGETPAGDLFCHMVKCPECSRLWEEQEELESALKTLPAAAPPAFFEARLKAAVFAGQAKKVPVWRPALVSLTAILVAAGTAWFMAHRLASTPEPAASAHIEAVIPNRSSADDQQAALSSPTAAVSAIYPVWPGDGDVVAGDDVFVMASLFPAPRPGSSVSVDLNGRDLSDLVRSEGELVTFSLGKLESGRHRITITLHEASGEKRSLTYSFFALEAQS